MAESKHFQFEIEGVVELNAVFNEIINDFSTDSKKILVQAMKEAMFPVWAQASLAAPVDTGALRASLRIEARKPNAKDNRSSYGNPNQVVIALVTTAPGNVLAKTHFLNMRSSDANINKNKKLQIKQVGIKSDAWANVQEFGSFKMPAKPYLRSSLESQSQNVTNSLGGNLANALDRYKARKATGSRTSNASISSIK